MIDQQMKMATCQIVCSEEAGTGWVIGKNRVLTARHVVLAAIERGEQITLTFRSDDAAAVFPAVVEAHDTSTDACILAVDNCNIQPLPISTLKPREGDDWQSFGYPRSRMTLGHRLTGSIERVFGLPQIKIDLDLVVDPSRSLNQYQGFSGSALISGGKVVGMLRLQIDRLPAAISLAALKEFLASNAIDEPAEESHTRPSEEAFAPREEFQRLLEGVIKGTSGDYIFIEGSHGLGKTTFCAQFHPEDEAIDNVGTYCILDPDEVLSPLHRGQPDVFFDWLNGSITELTEGSVSRRMTLSYSELTKQTILALDSLSKHCSNSSKKGVLFIDGLNELPTGSAVLTHLLGLLPVALPANITIILTAVSFTNLEPLLGGRVKSQNVLRMPPLTFESCRDYCLHELPDDLSNAPLIDLIWDRCKGHPLYLRYLVEYLNSHPEDTTLDEFPEFNGTIEEYYRKIWHGLLFNSNAVFLMAFVARLRWGIVPAELSKALTQPQRDVFISTLSNVSHLMESPDTCAIYHSSFATFIGENTASIAVQVETQLAEFCQSNEAIEYCLVNKIYHLLRAEKLNEAVHACDQDWVDRAVRRGVDPDLLLEDIRKAVNSSASQEPVTELFRLLLLAQRVTFRYDTLFALSARQMAEALIAIDRPRDALRHVCRLKSVIVRPGDAIHIAFLLHERGYDEEAIDLLNRLERKVVETALDKMTLGEYLNLCTFRIKTRFQARLAGWSHDMEAVTDIMDRARKACQYLDEKRPGLSASASAPVACQAASYFLAFRDVYTSFSDLEVFANKRRTKGVKLDPGGFLETLCHALIDFENTVDGFNLTKERKSFPQFFADLKAASKANPTGIEPGLASLVADTLIRLGAPADLVVTFHEISQQEVVPPIVLLKANGVDVDFLKLKESQIIWRRAAYIHPDGAAPPPVSPGPGNWQGWIEYILQCVFIYDGVARRRKADASQDGLSDVLSKLQTNVLHKLGFSLRERVLWTDAFAIPEQVLPLVYRSVTELLFDCYPEHLNGFIAKVADAGAGQCGLYTEGFRESCHSILTELTRGPLEGCLADSAFDLLSVWKSHVVNCVSNRHELVPELLRIIPLSVRLGANEEATRLYRYMLEVSMGPGWYKEDQLGVMTSFLGVMPVTDNASPHLARIAAFLENASGELTFQRFVRSEKHTFLRELARRGLSNAAVQYFCRQCCGTSVELREEAGRGGVDRVDPMHGSRYPGSGIDDQAGLLAIVEELPNCHWRLKWALLEIYHGGDDRHFEDFAFAFADLVNQAQPTELVEVSRRLQIIVGAETPSEAQSRFAIDLRQKLRPELIAHFDEIWGYIDAPSESSPQAANIASVSPSSTRTSVTPQDDFFFPGLFGKQSAREKVEALLAPLKRQKALGNSEGAKKLATQMLLDLQSAGWDIWEIWGRASEAGREAFATLSDGETSVSQVVRRYVLMLDCEVHAARWRQALCLAKRVSTLFAPVERCEILEHFIDHVCRMVGESHNEASMFTFLDGTVTTESSDPDLLNLILWSCDHPMSHRRDRAAAALLWLFQSHGESQKDLIDAAFSMKSGQAPDVLCGILDGLSLCNPKEVWTTIADNIHLQEVFDNLRHLSRLMVLRRIAERGAQAGCDASKIVISKISKLFSQQLAKDYTGHSVLPSWGNCIRSEWSRMAKEGMALAEIVRALSDALGELTAPFSVEDNYELENLVSESFNEHRSRPGNRWEANVRFALNTTLYKMCSVNDAVKLEGILRMHNPSLPEKTLTPTANPVWHDFNIAIEEQRFFTLFAGKETILQWIQRSCSASGALSVVECQAVLIPKSVEFMEGYPKLANIFRSTELPNFSAPSIAETCARLLPEFAVLGSFSPSTPSPLFLRLTGSTTADYKRLNWRSGRFYTRRAFAQPVHEGCSLTVSRIKLNIPAAMRLAWIIFVDGDFEAFVDEQNNFLA